MDADVCVVGLGLAGLGTATGLAKHKQRVVGLEATGLGRFDAWGSASRKHNGTLGGSGDVGVRAHFARLSLEAYKVAGLKMQGQVAVVRKKKVVATAENATTSDPDAAFEKLVASVREIPGITLRFDCGATHFAYDDGAWNVKTKDDEVVRARRLVVAAGPNARRILRELDFSIRTRNVLALAAQVDCDDCGAFIDGRRLPWTDDDWFARDAKSRRVHVAAYGDRAYVSGPRTRLRENYTSKDLDLSSARHERRIGRACKTARIALCAGIRPSAILRPYAGVLSFPTDAPYPLVGPVDDSLYLNTAHGNAGWCEAYGAGLVLADMIVLGVDHVGRTTTADGFQRDWASVIPALGYRVWRRHPTIADWATAAVKRLSVFLVSAHGCSATALTLAAIYSTNKNEGQHDKHHFFPGGLGGGRSKVFAWHPLLMVACFSFGMTQALLSFRTFPLGKKINKMLHVGWHSSAIACMSLGMVAVWRSHDRPQNHDGIYLPNIYSPHSMVGLFVIVMACAQYVEGILTFALPFAPPRVRKLSLPCHVAWGILVYCSAPAAIVSGIAEKSVYSGCQYYVNKSPPLAYETLRSPDDNPAENYQHLPDGCKVAAGVAVASMATMVCTVMAIVSIKCGAESDFPNNSAAEDKIGMPSAARPSELEVSSGSIA
ncbi:hypothetical protein CTAYLR_005674 [Chrysophaeum taylorii]|uniref:Cytochrome b561 domain-containing protein n=1 Tax=Chrysophaeum taylorii TaxID=2483200 RepID=A0AAD7ULB6_9STRA|nr:hypothetical protein CTAYLR_005674 [Chrysophaeum taylorii]